jgi:hypothetical protein
VNTDRPLTQQDVLNTLQLLRPWSTRRIGKVRVGNDYDGGYVLPSIALDSDAVVSIGVGHDVSFDMIMAQRGARILQFDHTVEKPPTSHPNFIFEKKGWAAETTGEFLGFDAIVQRLEALQPKRTLLKFDVEGAEYAALPAVRPQDLARFEVIACELHDLGRLAEPAFHQRFRQVLELLNAGHTPVHLHANNYAGVVLVEGIPIPSVLELTLLRSDLDSFPTVSNEPMPGPLDRPNHPGRADICLNPF